MEFDLQANTQIKTVPRKRLLLCSIFVGIVIFFVGFAIGFIAFKYSYSQSTKPKSSKVEGDANIRKFEEQFLRNVDAEKIGETLRLFSSQVHIAGSPRQKELAENLASQWKDYGFDRVEMPEYKVLLSKAQESQPNTITVEGQGYIDYKIEGKMKIFPDPRVNKSIDFYPFFGYSPNKTVEGDLVYVNNGFANDYEELRKMNITVKGKIVMSKQPFVGIARRQGAIGMVLFPDPSRGFPNGVSRDETYPNGPWLSSDAVQMQSAFNRPYVGDKLTPGVPANQGIYRKPYSNDSAFPQIPVQPISYGQAMELFKRLAGHNVPDTWQIPRFNMTLKTGPGFYNKSLKIKLRVNTQTKVSSIYNVIGTIIGSEEPDRYVIVGNHRDSWVLGAVDALSGTATTNELARVLGVLKKSGWKPRRTIKICSWGGEEWGLFGSTEWVEENSKELSNRAIGYINLDIAVQGDFVLRARASPLFKEITHKWAKKIRDPTTADGETTMYDTWLRHTPSKFFAGEPQLYNNFHSSDYVMFYDYLGIPASDYGYWYGFKNQSYMYPVYHTTEDTFYWVQKFVDPDFQVQKAMTQFGGGILLDLSDSAVIPYNVFDYAKVINLSYHILDKSHLMKSDKFLLYQMKYLFDAVQEFLKEAKLFQQRKATFLQPNSKKSSLELRMLNDKAVQVEQAFISSSGLLGKPYDRHLAFNFGFKNVDFIQATFPGVTDTAHKAVDTGDWEPVREQMSLVINSVRMATNLLKSDG